MMALPHRLKGAHAIDQLLHRKGQLKHNVSFGGGHGSLALVHNEDNRTFRQDASKAAGDARGLLVRNEAALMIITLGDSLALSAILFAPLSATCTSYPFRFRSGAKAKLFFLFPSMHRIETRSCPQRFLYPFLNPPAKSAALISTIINLIMFSCHAFLIDALSENTIIIFRTRLIKSIIAQTRQIKQMKNGHFACGQPRRFSQVKPHHQTLPVKTAIRGGFLAHKTTSLPDWRNARNRGPIQVFGLPTGIESRCPA